MRYASKIEEWQCYAEIHWQFTIPIPDTGFYPEALPSSVLCCVSLSVLKITWKIRKFFQCHLHIINNFFAKHMASVTHKLRICFLEKRNMPWIKYVYSVSTHLWTFFWTSTRWRHHNTLNIKRKNGHVLPPMRQRWRGNIFTQYESMIFTKQ